MAHQFYSPMRNAKVQLPISDGEARELRGTILDIIKQSRRRRWDARWEFAEKVLERNVFSIWQVIPDWKAWNIKLEDNERGSILAAKVKEESGEPDFCEKGLKATLDLTREFERLYAEKVG